MALIALEEESEKFNSSFIYGISLGFMPQLVSFSAPLITVSVFPLGRMRNAAPVNLSCIGLPSLNAMLIQFKPK